jgi:hypothetical protein
MCSDIADLASPFQDEGVVLVGRNAAEQQARPPSTS